MGAEELAERRRRTKKTTRGAEGRWHDRDEGRGQSNGGCQETGIRWPVGCHIWREHLWLSRSFLDSERECARRGVQPE